MPPSNPLIEPLTRGHASHIEWLATHVDDSLIREELEAILAAAYDQALMALSSSPDLVSSLAQEDQADAWIRAIAAKLATSRGRRGFEELGLPESEALYRRGAGTDLQQRIGEIFTSMAPEHRQILKLRYGDKMSVTAIRHVENMSESQWDHRHARAVKTFARALARGKVLSCEEGSHLLRTNPTRMLAGTGRGHVRSCVECRRVPDSFHRALAAAPLPIAIAAWKLDSLSYLSRGSDSASNAAVPAGDGGGGGLSALKGVLATKTAAITTSAVIAVAGTGGAVLMGSDQAAREPANSGIELPSEASPADEAEAKRVAKRKRAERERRRLEQRQSRP